MRREASERLANVKSDISQDNQKDVLAFIAGYKSLTEKWDALHQEYDDWRLTGGSCDQSKAIDTLGKFVVRFANLTSKIRQLPRSTSLRPLGELLVESAEREEKALRILQSSRRPFDPHVYLDFEQERNGVN